MINYTEHAFITDDDLGFWWKNLLNVLLIGDHGVGKTSIVRNYWDSLNINYVILSGGTLDPWTDLVGIPHKKELDGETVIEYAVPQTIRKDLEAIFIDEINRAPAKVRNALMELILSRSINGRKFPKLRVVWGAANPDDSENNYDVEALDPAQEDRFPVIIKLSNKPQVNYFSKKYGAVLAEKAINWHQNLPEDIRKLISPRRLDYALDYVVNLGGNARHIFPHEQINTTAFTKAVKGDDRMKELVAAANAYDLKAIAKFFKDKKKSQGCLREILKQYKYAKLLATYGDMEELMGIAESDPRFSLILAEVQRDDKDVAINECRVLNSVDPEWHVTGVANYNAARTLTSLFVDESDQFPMTSLSEIKIPALELSLDNKEINQILEDYSAPTGLFISSVDEGSAVNGLRFAIRVFKNIDPGKDLPKVQSQKFHSILFSSLNFFYERDGHLAGAIYDVPGSEAVIRVLPKQVRPAPKKVLTVPPKSTTPAQRVAASTPSNSASYSEELW